MNLHTRSGFAAYVESLPGVTVNEQWESLVAKVGGKVFALVGMVGNGQVVFKVPETSFEILTTQDGIAQAFYFAKRQWVSVLPGALDEDALKAYIARSHRIIAGKLTRKVKTELGLDTYLAAGESSSGSTA